MLSITYLSSASRSMTAADIDEILAVSRDWNSSHGLTGLLMFSGGNFLQTLEGPAGEVEPLFAQIGRDARHTGVTEALRFETEDRLFGEWSMAFRDQGFFGDARRHEAMGPAFFDASIDDVIGAGGADAYRHSVGVFLRAFADSTR